MENNYTLHKLPQGFIVTSNETSYPNDTVISTVTNTLVKFTDPRHFSDGTYFKIIAQQDQIDFSSLKEEEQKEIGWFDAFEISKSNVEKIYSKYIPKDMLDDYVTLYQLGFQKAQELLSDRRFTEGDIKRAYRNGWSNREESKIENPPYLHNDSSWGENGLNKFIQSLSQQSWKVECVEENGKIKILKLL